LFASSKLVLHQRGLIGNSQEPEGYLPVTSTMSLISLQTIPPGRKTSMQDSQSENSLRGALTIYRCLALDRHKPFMKPMRVLVKLRQESAPGFIEPNVFDQHSGENA
jgi:hypothetical protein